MSDVKFESVERSTAISMLLESNPDTTDELRKMLNRIPSDAEWFSGWLDEEIFENLRHIYHESWDRLSDGSGRINITAERLSGDLGPGVDGEQEKKIRQMAESFDLSRAGMLTLGANNIEAGPFLIIDGNHRCTSIAILRSLDPTIPIPSLPITVCLSRQPIWNWDEH